MRSALGVEPLLALTAAAGMVALMVARSRWMGGLVEKVRRGVGGRGQKDVGICLMQNLSNYIINENTLKQALSGWAVGLGLNCGGSAEPHRTERRESGSGTKITIRCEKRIFWLRDLLRRPVCCQRVSL